MTGEKRRKGRGRVGRGDEGREGEVGCGARRPAVARGPALAKDGPACVYIGHVMRSINVRYLHTYLLTYMIPFFGTIGCRSEGLLEARGPWHSAIVPQHNTYKTRISSLRYKAGPPGVGR